MTPELWSIILLSLKVSGVAVLPETAAPSPGAFEEAYRRAKADGCTGVVAVTLSSDLSATYQSAELAARSVADEIDVRVVDSRALTLALGLMVITAAEAAESGASLDDVVERASRRGNLRSMPLPPFMHGAAHWNALSTWLSGGTVVIQGDVDHFDAAEALRVADDEAVTSTVIVGDAFARPLLEALEAGAPRPGSLRHVLSSGAILSRPVAEALRAALPDVRLLDVLGSSESGRQGINVTAPGTDAASSSHANRRSVTTPAASMSAGSSAGSPATCAVEGPRLKAARTSTTTSARK